MTSFVFEEKLNASENPSVRGKKMSKRLGSIMGCKNRTSINAPSPGGRSSSLGEDDIERIVFIA